MKWPYLFTLTWSQSHQMEFPISWCSQTDMCIPKYTFVPALTQVLHCLSQYINPISFIAPHSPKATAPPLSKPFSLQIYIWVSKTICILPQTQRIPAKTHTVIPHKSHDMHPSILLASFLLVTYSSPQNMHTHTHTLTQVTFQLTAPKPQRWANTASPCLSWAPWHSSPAPHIKTYIQKLNLQRNQDLCF
jgi:hypothetical protein